MRSMNRFSGTNVLVTGAASGIGAATVRRLVSEGAAVFAVDRDEEGLSETVASALGSGRVETAVVDVTDEAGVARVVNDAVTRLGGIEALDRKSVGSGKGVSVSVGLGGARHLKK